MKKISLFLILIFSVFFSYKTAFASTIFSNTDTSAHTYFNPFRFQATASGNLTGFTGYGYASSGILSSSDNFVLYTADPSTGGNLGNLDCNSTTNTLSGFGFSPTFPTDYTSDVVTASGFTGTQCLITTGDYYGIQLVGNYLSTVFWGSGTNPYGVSGEVLGTVLSTTTRIQDVLPTNGSTTTSTSVDVSLNYYLGDPDPLVYDSPPVAVNLYLHRTDAIGTPDQKLEDDSPVYNSLTAIAHTFILPTNSTWELRFDLSGSDYYFVSPLATPTTFNVVSDPATGTTGTTTCSLTDIAGCFQNALVFLFYPSSASINQFNGLYTQFINKPPFGYIVAIQNALKGINDTNTSVFTLQSLPILNTYIFTPLYNAIEWILWVAFAFVMYHRLKNIAL
jgi:hypothetical protein